MARCLRKTLTGWLLAGMLLFAGCIDEAPITGRRQLSLVSSSALNTMALQEYSSFLKKNKLSKNPRATAQVKRVGKRLAAAVKSYFAKQGQAERLQGYDWQFNLVENKEKNAWCMPGGRVVIYTGILPITKDDTGLAVVMAHEIAHAIAEHGKERMSQQMLVALGGVALNQVVKDKSGKTKSIFLTAYGVGTGVGYLLRYSRIQENEADELGLYFMAMAGYDPHAAVEFWDRMRQSKSGARPPEFLSTHPADESRIHNMRKHLPKALEHYHKANKPGTHL